MASAVANDSSGNIYVTGYTYSFCCGSPDAFLVKFNPTGSLLWQRAWPDNISSSIYGAAGNALAVDAVGNAYITGYVVANSSSADHDVLLLKFDANGDLLWQRRWGGVGNDEGLGIARDPSGGVYVTGSTSSPLSGLGKENAFVLKLGTNGSIIWQEVWGWTINYNSGSGIAVDSSGNVFVSASFMPFSIPSYPVLLKLNSTGALQWEETWGRSGYTSGFDAMAVYVDSSGNAYLTGSVGGYVNGSLIDGIPIMKFDASGAIIWQEVCLVAGYADGLVTDASGNIFLTGSSDLLLLELSSKGGLELEAGASNLGIGRSITADSAGNPIVAGSTSAEPPYSLTELNYAVVALSYTPETAVGFVDIPSLSALPLNLSVLAPLGSQTYSGQSDVFIMDVASPQSRPSPPLALIAEAGKNNILLSWAPSEFNGRSPITGYHIYRGESSSGETLLANTSNVLSYVDTIVKDGVTYFYYVKAVNTLGESDFSNEAYATTATPGLPEFVPSDSTLLVGTSTVLAALAAFMFYRRRKSVIRSSTTSLFER